MIERDAPPSTDAELLEAARALLWDLFDNCDVDLHAYDEDGVTICDPAECDCPRTVAFNRILHGWKPPEER